MASSLVPTAAAVMLAICVAGCPDRSPTERRTQEKRDDQASSAAHAGSTPAPAPRGIAAAGNDPAVLELARKALGCRWDSSPGDGRTPGRGLSRDCPAALAWLDASDGFGDGRADPTLVRMLEDADERTRWLAATKLHASGKTFRGDRALADQVVLAGEHETSPRVGAALGVVLADLRVDATGTFDRVRAIARRHAVAPLRAALVANIAWQNPSSSPAYELTRELVRDPEREVRMAAVAAFYMGGGRQPEMTCSIWLENADHGVDTELRAAAAELVSRWGRCQASYDALLDVEERGVKELTATAPRFATALGYVCEDTKSKPAQRDRSAELLRKMAEQKQLEPDVRAAALEALLKCDPVGGRVFVKRFTAEDPPQLKERAIELLRPRTKG